MTSSYAIRTGNGEIYHKEQTIHLDGHVYEEQGQKVDTHFAHCRHKEIHLDKAAIIIRDDNILSPLQMDIKFDFPYLKVQFALEGSSTYTPNTSDGVEVTINSNQFNFFYLPKVDGTLSFPVQQQRSLEIIISEQYLRNTFKSGFEHVSGELGEALDHKTPFKLFEQSQNIPSSLLLIVNEIVNCSYQREIKEVYLESKVKEIVSHLFSIINTKENTKPQIRLSEQERHQIVQIEQVLKEKLRNSLTIKELANLSGINETKLKRNFKLVTGKPIFSYLTDMRMEKAKNLLINPERSVSEVAYAVGYKNPQHFTSAFKRRFNYVPSDFRKSVQNAMF